MLNSLVKPSVSVGGSSVRKSVNERFPRERVSESKVPDTPSGRRARSATSVRRSVCRPSSEDWRDVAFNV